MDPLRAVAAGEAATGVALMLLPGVVTIRSYQPKESLLNGSYALPPVVKAGSLRFKRGIDDEN